MIAEGSSSSSQTPVPRGESSPQGERDLLAERRARRVAESGETVLLRRAEAAEATIKTLETHISSLQQRLREAEGNQRRTADLAERLERVESALQAIRESHRRMAATIGELKDVTVRLRAAADRGPIQEPAHPRREEMADALAAAVERLRARADELASTPPPHPRPSAAQSPAAPAVESKPHKHSMSLIGRVRAARAARKHRREAR
jgi:chromosome segregation ATPase